MSAPIEREFTASPTSPSAARGFTTSALHDLLPPRAAGRLCEDIELIVSELVTNAVRAGSATVHVAVSREVSDDRDRIVLRVRDDAEGWPEQRDAGIHDVNGRGLALVSAICAAWGVRLAERGKVVWAELDVSA